MQVVKLEMILRYIRRFNWSTNSAMVMSGLVPIWTNYTCTHVLVIQFGSADILAIVPLCVSQLPGALLSIFFILVADFEHL